MMVDKKKSLQITVRENNRGKTVCSFSVFYFEADKVKLMFEIGYRKLKERGVV